MFQVDTISKIPDNNPIIIKYGYPEFKNYYSDCEMNTKKMVQ